MSWNNRVELKSMKALSDMTGLQFRIVELATSEPNACDYAAGRGGYGIITNEPKANEFASVALDGEIQCRGGVAISIGDYITTATSATGGPGWATQVVSGSTATGMQVLGRALTSCASGGVFTLDLEVRRVFGVSSAGLITT